MKNLNRYIGVPVLVFALIYVVGCATTTTAPKDWLSSVSDAQRESYGGWVTVKYHTGDSGSEAHGELIAIHPSQIFILTEQGLTNISIDSITHVKLTTMRLAGDTSLDKYRQVIYPVKPLDAFRAYARFPQGVSKAFDTQFLKPKRSDEKILIPRETLKSLQKDQSIPLEDHAQQPEAVAAAERDANTDYGAWSPIRDFLGGGRSDKLSLPIGQLLGKSPEYVAFYAAAYAAKVKSLQRKNKYITYAVCCLGYVGCLIGIGVFDVLWRNESHHYEPTINLYGTDE